MLSLQKIKIFICYVLVMSCSSAYIMTAPEEIFKKTVRTKRPNKLKEEIAQLCILCLEYSTELLDMQAQLQSSVAGKSCHDVYRLLADTQKALYARIKELAESDKNAFLNQASSRELQAIITKIDSFVVRAKELVVRFKQCIQRDISQQGKKNSASVQLDQESLIDLLQAEKNFFVSGCKVAMLQKVDSPESKNKA